MRALLTLWCVACACASAAAGQRLRVCGRELAETLSLLCRDRGGFNDLPPPHLRGAVSRGVADDCCRLGCQLSTLLRYCKFDDVVQPARPRTSAGADDEACDADEDDDELFSLQLLHRQEGWCGTWRPAAPAPPGGDVECTCSRGDASGSGQLENVVRKEPRQPRRKRPRQRQRPPSRQPPRQPQTTPATRRPVVRGTVTPYFAGRPVAVVLSPPHTQPQPQPQPLPTSV